MPIHLILSEVADSPKIPQSFVHVLSLMKKKRLFGAVVFFLVSDEKMPGWGGGGGANIRITPSFSESWRSAIRGAGRLFEWTDCGAQCAHAQLVGPLSRYVHVFTPGHLFPVASMPILFFFFFLATHICWGSPVQSGAKRPKLKIQRLVCWERENKLEPGNTVLWFKL